MDGRQLQQALDNLQSVRAWYKANSVYERYKLSPIWITNIEKWFNNLFKLNLAAANPKEIIGILHDKAFFDVSVSHPQLPFALDWFEQFLEARGWPLQNLPPDICESPLFSDDRCAVRAGRRVSSDFLWRLCLIERLGRAVPANEASRVVVELGSGSGNFARAFRLFHPGGTYVCIDLPESLFFANLYLHSNFPDARIHYVRSPDEVITDLSAYDFVFIPTEFAGCLIGHHIDLFVNMNSMGEMTNEVISYWFDFIQTKADIAYVFLLNRFLNRVDPAAHPYRRDESSCSLQFDGGWDILDWEVDPDFERSPYVTTLITRNLLVIARRDLDEDLRGEATGAVLTRLPAVEMEDWVVRPYWDNYKLLSGGSYPPLNSRGDLNFTLDLTRSGSLFTIWEAFRLTRSERAARLLRAWMVVHGGTTTPFEEVYFLSAFISDTSA